MSELAIRVEGIRKRYRIGQRLQHCTLRELVAHAAAGPWRWLATRDGRPQLGTANYTGDQQDLWALNGVTFDVAAGEVVGIIGRNGAGKSTLLKILSRITEPTEGYAEIRGRVGSLLEVGTGFHPELTGRENIYLNGAILGMRKAEIERNMEEIISFAGVSRFIDTPVKYFSSGMYLRLAFAVAAHLESEVLLVDEALAVGDAEFQKKCLAKMNDVAQKGRTVIFVSHNLLAIQDLCHRAIWLDEGQIVALGPTDRVVSRYLQTGLPPSPERTWSDPWCAPGTERVRLHRATVCVADASHADAAAESILTVRDPFLIEYSYWILEPLASMYVSIYLYNEQGILLFNSGPPSQPSWRSRPVQAGLYREFCRVPGDLLNNGVHRVVLEIIDQETVYRHDDLLVFEVHDTVGVRDQWYGTWEGAVRPILCWDGEYIANTIPATGTNEQSPR